MGTSLSIFINTRFHNLS